MTTSVRWIDREKARGSSFRLTATGLWLCAALCGCGPKTGAWLMTMGLANKEKIPAEYRLPAGGVLVLVDDDEERVEPPDARLLLVDETARQLRAAGLTDRVTTNEELAAIRQSEPRFDERGAQQIGQLAKADIVLWLKVVRFVLNPDLEMVLEPARFAVELRVLDARAETRDKVRLWPETREGRTVEATVPAQEIRACKTLKEAHQKVAAALAAEIVNLFHDREVVY